MLVEITITAVVMAGILVYRRVTTGDWSFDSPENMWQAHNLAGQRLARARRYEDAERRFLKAVALVDYQHDRDRAVVACMGNLSDLYRQQKRFEECHRLMLEVIAADDRLQADSSWHGRDYVTRMAYRLFMDWGRYADAESAIRDLANYDSNAVPPIVGEDDDLKRLAKAMRMQERTAEADHIKKLIKQRQDERAEVMRPE